MTTKLCPCGTGQSYVDCCGALHSGARTAATAEQLMRSRYSAFAVSDEDYLLRTWHSRYRPESAGTADNDRWLKLEILDTENGGLLQTEGVVEFRAHYVGGVVHERSRFARENGQWVYLEGDQK
ncbi:YchJ family protein [Lentzea guizhouensis]|uniref:YchJ family protein n=1 Tax=Lentzea guizhouensis TaxID=1586287 RepID=UPI0012B69FF4|nr:YchJ family metal-binding protein [Lentzea guizhouensis]